MDIILLLFIFVIAAFLGTELISKVPSQLHTPLMSATNAISGIAVVGALAVCAALSTGTLGMILAFIAIILASVNVVGGYVVTERMLGMFRKKKEDKD
ncbi:MAG: NAD(P) transhydrogenase subunit alpha [Oscillospiraceae bacterium]|nr:NAD(P) transhydrogenase subunit alpha [Oscillospiraceae bacterium]